MNRTLIVALYFSLCLNLFSDALNYSLQTNFALTGKVENFILDEDRERIFITYDNINQVSVQRLSNGSTSQTLLIGLDPKKIAITRNGNYLAVNAENSSLMTVFDLNSLAEIGRFSASNFNDVFEISPINQNDFIFVTIPDSFGSPPFGGTLNIWRGSTEEVVEISRGLSEGWGARNFLWGLDNDAFVISKWGFSQGGIDFIQNNISTNIVTDLDEFQTLTFHRDSTMTGFDFENRRLVVQNNVLEITSDSLVKIAEIPEIFPDTIVGFSPLNNQVIGFGEFGSSQFSIFNVFTDIPIQEIDLPTNARYKGKYSFGDNGCNLYILAEDSNNSTRDLLLVYSLKPDAILTRLLFNTECDCLEDSNMDGTIDVADIVFSQNQ